MNEYLENLGREIFSFNSFPHGALYRIRAKIKRLERKRIQRSTTEVVFARILSPSRRGFTLIEVLLALTIMAVVVTVFLATNTEGLRKSSRARQLSDMAFLAREKLAEVSLGPRPTQEEESDWQMFTDPQDPEADNGYRWRKRLKEAPFNPPGSTGAVSGFRAWELSVTVAPAEELEGDRAVTLVQWIDIPPLPTGGQ